VVISGNAFKETEVDFNKGNSRDVVSWLLDDDELEEQLRATQAKREAEEAEALKNGIKRKGRGKKKIGIASLESPAASRTLEDLYHEGSLLQFVPRTNCKAKEISKMLQRGHLARPLLPLEANQAH
jgi:hypothetical protein